MHGVQSVVMRVSNHNASSIKHASIKTLCHMHSQLPRTDRHYYIALRRLHPGHEWHTHLLLLWYARASTGRRARAEVQCNDHCAPFWGECGRAGQFIPCCRDTDTCYVKGYWYSQCLPQVRAAAELHSLALQLTVHCK